MKLTSLHKTILETPGVSGHEGQVRELLKKEYKKMGYEYVTDNLGSIFAVKKSKTKNAPNVMLAAHMDEVGFTVREINAQGLVKLNMIGGIWEQNIMAQRVILTTRKGKEFKGAILATSKHILSAEQLAKPVGLGQMEADFGFKNKEDAIKHGINIGDQVTFDAPVVELENGRVLGKALDDRMGCIIGLEVLKKFKDKELPFNLYIGATVQEEVGTRGAASSVNLVKPDFALVCDVSAARDHSNPNEMGVIGKGTMIRVMDTGHITPVHLVEYQEDIAKKNKIDVQYYISAGGTDARVIHQSLCGIPTIQTAMVARSIHNSCSVMDMHDVEQTIKMIEAILKDFSAKRLKEWTNL